MERKEPYATEEEFNRNVIRYRAIPEVELVPGVFSHILSSENMTAIFTKMTPNGCVPIHRHVHEQIMIIVEGECDQLIDGKRYHLKEGDVVCYASNQEHGTYVSDKGCRTIEIFSPLRQEYMDKLEAVKKNLGK
jgi:quercetin dioxygenase-like cupin family protein